MQIGIDVGTYSIKCSEGEEYTFEARFLLDETYMDLEDSVPNKGRKVDKVVFEGKNYLVGEGTFDLKEEKAKRKHFMLSIATMLAKVCNGDDHNIDLSVGLPIGNYKHEKDELKEFIMKNNEISIQLNDDEEQHFTIKNVVVVPEGVGVFLSLQKDFIKLIRGRKILMLDIGGRTLDACIIDENCKVSKVASRNLGMMFLYNKAMNQLRDAYPQSEIKVEQMPRIFKEKSFFYGKQMKDIEFDPVPFYEILAEEIMSFVELQYPEYNSYITIIAGGGAKDVGSYVQKSIPKSIIKEEVTNNAVGFKNRLIKLLGGKK